MICTCYDSGISINQEKVHEELFYSTENLNRIVIPTSVDAERKNLYILLPRLSGIGEHSVDMFECFSNGEIRKYKKEVEYMTSLLDLFSSLCKGRNFICKASVSNILPVELLVNNIWNENLSKELRATFLDLLMNMHIDFQPRSYSKKPELIRTLEKNSMQNFRTNFYNRHAMLNIDSGTELIRKIGKKFPLISNKLKKPSKIYDEFTILPMKEELDLFKLKCELILFFDELEDLNFDILMLQMIKLANMLVKFEVISTECSNMETTKCVVSPSKEFVKDEMDIIKLLKASIKILFRRSESGSSTVLLRRPTITSDGPKPGVKKVKKVARIIKTSSFTMEDSFERYMEGVKEYLRQQATDFGTSNQFDGIEIECKLEMCELVYYMHDLRQDYLINNFIEWYKKCEEISEVKILKLMPPLMKFGNKKSEKKAKKFKEYFQPVLEPLTYIYPGIIEELLMVFIASPNFKLKTKLLEIILRFSSQRKEMFKYLRRIKIMTAESDPEIILWSKINISTLRNLAEQSEIICKYWTQKSALYEKTIEKVETLITLLISFEKIMHRDCSLIDGELISTKQAIDADRQTMLCNLGFHTYIINLIKDGLHILDGIYQEPKNDKEKEAKARLIKLFSLCFKTLRSFVYKNPKNQRALYSSIDVICLNLKIQVTQIDLLCEIFRDNAGLCSYITESFLRQFIDLICSEGRQTIFLEFFDVIVEINGVGNLNIQRIILMLLCQPQYFEHVCYMNDGKFVFEPKQDDSNELYVDQPYVYQAKLINVLSKCGSSASKFQLTREKCQKIIPLSEIFSLLLKDGPFKALEFPLLNFFLKIYLCSDLNNEELENNSELLEIVKLKTVELKYSMEDSKRSALLIEKWAEVLEVFCLKYTTHDHYFRHTSSIISAFLKCLEEHVHIFKTCCIKNSTYYKLDHLGEIFSVKLDWPFREHDTYITEVHIDTDERERWSNVLETLSGPKFIKSLKKERIEFLNALFHIQDSTLGLSSAMVIKSLVHYISFSMDYNLPTNLLYSLIKIISFHLKHPQILNQEKPKNAIARVQEEYRELGVTNIITSMMCQKELNSRLFGVLIVLSNKLLDGASEKMQGEFYECFISLGSSENFFHRIHLMISQYTSSIAHSSGKILKKQSKDIYRIIKLLQLFCENHYEPLQNYIRNQTRSRNSYDLVKSVIILLHELMRRRKLQSFHIIRSCFQVLTESMQGPCPQNQKAIINGNFLEIATNILSIDENSSSNAKYAGLKDIKNSEESTEGDCLYGWMISDLKYKCLTTLLSLLEGQTDNYIIIRMVRAFNLQVFKESLVSIFRMYLIIKPNNYNKDLFNHFKNNKKYNFASKVNPQLSDTEYYTFIIENGFLIYHLLNHFDSINDEEVKKLISTELPEFTAQKNKLLSEEKDNKDNLAQQTKRLFQQNLNLFSILLGPDSANSLSDFEILNMALDFFEKNTGRIEIKFQGILSAAYFWLPPICKHLTIEVKEEFHDTVERSTDKKKIEGLLSKAEDIIGDMEYEEKLSKVYGYKAMTRWVRRFKTFVFILAVLLNIVIVLSYSAFGTDRFSEPSYLNVEPTSNNFDSITSTKLLISVVGTIHCILSAFIFLSFIIKAAPIIILRLWQRQETPSQDSQEDKPKLYINKLKIFLLTCFYTLSNVDILYHLLYFGFSLLGVIVHPLFYSAHLLDVMYRFPSLQGVVMAVVLPWRSLLLTLIFILIIIYYFSIWAYVQFEADFRGIQVYSFVGPDNRGPCDNLASCFKSVFDLGIKSSGGIGMWLDWIYTPSPDSINSSRFFFDNLFTIVILWIMLNIIQGIIIVTFAEIREEEDSNSKDINNKCFICGKEKEAIERLSGNSFYFHKKYEHNEWNYVFFIAYLEFKKKSEFSGIESYAMQMISNEDIDWIPQQEALSFKSQNKIEETLVLEATTSAQEHVKLLRKEIKQLRSLLRIDESKYANS